MGSKVTSKSVRKAALGAVVVVVICFAVCASQVLYSFDKLLADPLYQQASASDNRIRILAIDEKTLSEYGEFADWSRDIPARLVKVLDGDPAHAPAVIAFDVMFVSERDKKGDEAFAAACAEGGNVVTAISLMYRDEVTLVDGTLLVDDDKIAKVEYPYSALRGVSDFGFANTYLDADNYIRYARLSVDYDGEQIWSFPAAVYLEYLKKTSASPTWPETDARGFYNFAYTGGSGAYEVVSLCDVLEGRVDTRFFKNCIVLVGAYSPGMQDAYLAPIQRGSQMYGVEIQANILEAIMEGHTGLPVDNLLYAVIVTLIALAYYFVTRKLKIVPAAIVGVALMGAYIVCAKFLYDSGHVVRVIEPILAVLIIYAFQLVFGYLAETLKKRRILAAFKQYVAPQVVQEVAEKGDFEIKLGGEKRHVAVLFVDIRGFTPMSEGLQPEEVVEILNEYLSLTTNSIFANGGTLDKFIGDATMAVFNAPFDLDDYVYRAVCTARDIAAGSKELESTLMERFGKSVSFGIGVNCGDAVVGNIGCDFRMDYTAIGDTVNTAARLESNAKRGQILISQDVYEAVKDRVRVTDVGVIPLKGKSNEIYIYQLDEVM